MKEKERDYPILPCDYSRCANELCSVKSKCLRYLAWMENEECKYFSITSFEGGSTCHGYIPKDN